MVLTFRQKNGQKCQMAKTEKAKTVNYMVICDNKCNIAGILDCIDGNHHDSFEIIEQVEKCSTRGINSK
jgi:hypothetical protein